MRALILTFALGLALAASAQAALLAPQPAAIELDAAPLAELVSGGWGGGGTGTIGKIAGETCVGVAALRTGGGDPAPAAKAAEASRGLFSLGRAGPFAP